jgi:Uncharacterized protein containing a NRPS condensation (elongation) domain
MSVSNPTIYPAESADVKHFISGQQKRNDHFLHAAVRLNGKSDIDLLKRALTALFPAVPLLTCRFQADENRAEWISGEWTAEDMIRLVETEDREQALQDHLVIQLDEQAGPQARITVIREPGCDTIAFVFNHMICDGGGFRDFLYLLSRSYSYFETHPSADRLPFPLPDPEKRGMDQVFNGMSPQQVDEIRKAELHSYAQTEKDHLPLTGDAEKPFIIHHKVDRKQFQFIKSYARKQGATINDALFAVYICALSEVLPVETIVLDCPVNARAYLPKGYLPGICNLTSNYICAVPKLADPSFDEALKRVKQVMDREKVSLAPLKVYWELDEVYKKRPLAEAVQEFPKIYRIPINGMTNIGILDPDQLNYGDCQAVDAFISGSIKYAPYFQVAVTTFNGEITFSTNFHGTEQDHLWLEQFVDRMIHFFPSQE